MKFKNHLIIFSKVPRYAGVKKRLAKGIGQVAARKFYAKTSTDIIKIISNNRVWQTILCVTPDDAALQCRFWKEAKDRIPQGHGNLGERMERALLQFPNQPVIIVGSDIPEISQNIIKEAFSLAKRSDLVFGPSSDGGYWLVGARIGSLTRGLFKNVRWSTENALADTLKNTGIKRTVFVNELDDIDDVTDLINWSNQRS